MTGDEDFDAIDERPASVRRLRKLDAEIAMTSNRIGSAAATESIEFLRALAGRLEGLRTARNIFTEDDA